MMENNTWKMREVVRKIENMQRRLDRINTVLYNHIDRDNVSDELLRALSSPTDELDLRIEQIEGYLRDTEE